MFITVFCCGYFIHLLDLKRGGYARDADVDDARVSDDDEYNFRTYATHNTTQLPILVTLFIMGPSIDDIHNTYFVNCLPVKSIDCKQLVKLNKLKCCYMHGG